MVTGATGMQGGAVARSLRHAGIRVVALVRDPASAAARALRAGDISLAVGDFDAPASLEEACAGCTSVFSVQPAPFADPDSERRQARALIDAARAAGVVHLVHTSVSGTGWRAHHPAVDAGEMRNYWDSKEDVEALVRSAGFNAYTIFKPAFFMENFLPPKTGHMFPHLAGGELVVATDENTEVALVAAGDLGCAVTAAVTDRRRFEGAEIELGGDTRTFPEIAATIAEVTGAPVSPRCLPRPEVDARMGRRSWSATQAWFDGVGYPARPHHAAAYGLDLTGFRHWAVQHRDELRAARNVNSPRV
ncbi:NmrA family NAD(P)-binding protein [Actinomadura physcomitrii]|nr:NmrA family NAD(P)-binding protein [Actinomadura physcomitrii]